MVLETTPKPVSIAVDNVSLEGLLNIPEKARGFVLFAHGSGSSRHSPRNVFIAEKLNQAKLGTLLFNLLSDAEAREDEYSERFRFDIPFLSKRLLAVTNWAMQQKELKNLTIGYFGASTGAAAALEASLSAPIRAVVSRGGRPDLVPSPLSQIQTPTLLIVGSLDKEVLELNRWAYKNLRCEKQLADVPGASHLFTEPGSLETVAVLASHWFEKYLATKT